MTRVTLRLVRVSEQNPGRSALVTNHASDRQRPGLERLDQDHHANHADVDDGHRQRIHRACRRHVGRETAPTWSWSRALTALTVIDFLWGGPDQPERTATATPSGDIADTRFFREIRYRYLVYKQHPSPVQDIGHRQRRPHRGPLGLEPDPHRA